jgi:hypothetical protein
MHAILILRIKPNDACNVVHIKQTISDHRFSVAGDDEQFQGGEDG